MVSTWVVRVLGNGVHYKPISSENGEPDITKCGIVEDRSRYEGKFWATMGPIKCDVCSTYTEDEIFEEMLAQFPDKLEEYRASVRARSSTIG